MKANLYVSDEDITKSGELLLGGLTDAEKVYAQFIAVLKESLTSGLMSGQTSRGMANYLTAAQSLTGVFETMGMCLNLALDNFLGAVDDADEYIY